MDRENYTIKYLRRTPMETLKTNIENLIKSMQNVNHWFEEVIKDKKK